MNYDDFLAETGAVALGQNRTAPTKGANKDYSGFLAETGAKATAAQQSSPPPLSGGYISPTGDYVPPQAIPGVMPSATAQPAAPTIQLPPTLQPAQPVPNAFWAPGGRDIVANSGWLGRNVLAPAGDVAGDILGTAGTAVRGAQGLVANALSPINPLLARDIAALPEAFPLAGRELGAPNAGATPSWTDLKSGLKSVTTEPWARDPVTGELKAPPGAPPTQTAASIPKTAADAKGVASDWYAEANRQGGTLTPQFTDKFIDGITDKLQPSEVGQIISGDTDLTRLLSRMQALKGRSLALNDVQSIDEELGDLMDKHYDPIKGMDKEGMKIGQVQSGLRDQINSADAGDVSGGKQGFDGLVNGRAAWSQAMKMSDVERIIDRASRTLNPPTSIQNQVNTFLSNQRKSRGFTDDEFAALEQAGQRGAAGQVLSTLGSRLVPYVAGGIGSSIGGWPGTLAGYVIGEGGSYAARAAAEALAKRRMANPLNVIARGVPPSPLTPP